jgi:hypothetical protein
VLSRLHCPTIIAITESWLNPDIPDVAVYLDNFNVMRKDRFTGSGGGVMLYISSEVNSRRLSNFECDNFEVMWAAVRPKVLPRPLSILIVGVVYCPPSYDVNKKRDLACYILDAVDKLMKLYPDAGIFICGDFNTLDTGLFNKHLHLNQLITTATRGNNILDKFFYQHQTLLQCAFNYCSRWKV